MAKAQAQGQLTLAAVGGKCACLRCGAPCQLAPVPGSQARWIKKASVPRGLCINCAVHDVLRNLYPVNLLLAQSAGKGLLHPHIQDQFFHLAQMHGTDATLEEIDWQAIVANWDLPFPTKLKATACNPVSQEELDRAKEEGEQHRANSTDKEIDWNKAG